MFEHRQVAIFKQRSEIDNSQNIVWELRSTHEIGEYSFFKYVRVLEVSNTADKPNPTGLLPL